MNTCPYTVILLIICYLYIFILLYFLSQVWMLYVNNVKYVRMFSLCFLYMYLFRVLKYASDLISFGSNKVLVTYLPTFGDRPVKPSISVSDKK